MSDRRSFLRGLAALPLIGGSVTLIGNPTAAAVAPTCDLLESYKAWLRLEHSMLTYEMVGYDRQEWKRRAATFQADTPGWEWHDQWSGKGGRGMLGWIDAPQPSTRAAVVLSAAGVPLNAGGRP